MVHLCEKDYLLIESEGVLVISGGEGAHEVHVGKFVDAEAIAGLLAT